MRGVENLKVRTSANIHSVSPIRVIESSYPKSDTLLPLDILDLFMEMIVNVNAFAAAEYCYCLKICHVHIAT